MNNFESGNNGGGENNSGSNWDILSREDVVTEFQKQQESERIREEVKSFEESEERLQQTLAARRLEKLKKQEEAEARMGKLSKRLLVGGLAALALVGVMFAHNLLNEPEFMDREGSIEKVSPVAVETVVFTGGPNLRKDPAALGGEDSNLIMDMGESDQKITLTDYNDEAIFLRKENDPNGNWWGFKANELANAFQKNSFMKKGDANRIRRDKDGYVWVNSKYVDVTRAEESSIN